MSYKGNDSNGWIHIEGPAVINNRPESANLTPT